MYFCSKFANCNFNWWWVMAWTSSKWGKFWLWSSIWPWRSRSIVPQNNRDLNQGLYISGPNLVILAETGDELLHGQAHDWHTDGHTDRQTQATTIPEGQNWPRVKTHTLQLWDFARFGSETFYGFVKYHRSITTQNNSYEYCPGEPPEGPEKSHEKVLNFTLEFLYEPWDHWRGNSWPVYNEFISKHWLK